MSSYWSKGVVASVLLACLLAWFKPTLDPEDAMRERMATVLDNLLHDEAHLDLGPRRIAVGYGACQDLFINAKSLFANEEAPEEPEHYQEIHTAQQLTKMFAYFFQFGAAAE